MVKVDRGWMGYPAVFVNKVFLHEKYSDFPIYKICITEENLFLLRKGKRALRKEYCVVE